MDDEQVRALAAEILARDEYARFRPSPVGSAWTRLIETLRDFLRDLPGLLDASPVLYWSLLFGLLAIAGLLIAHIAWTVQRSLQVQPPPEAHVALSKTRDFSAEARALAAQGAYLEASHRMLLASLAHSARQQLLSLEPQDSNRRVCRKLAEARLPSGLRRRLRELIERTDAAWFGHRRDDPALFAAWQAVYVELSELGR